jgi:hypothetical protein
MYYQIPWYERDPKRTSSRRRSEQQTKLLFGLILFCKNTYTVYTETAPLYNSIFFGDRKKGEWKREEEEEPESARLYASIAWKTADTDARDT